MLDLLQALPEFEPESLDLRFEFGFISLDLCSFSSHDSRKFLIGRFTESLRFFLG